MGSKPACVDYSPVENSNPVARPRATSAPAPAPHEASPPLPFRRSANRKMALPAPLPSARHVASRTVQHGRRLMTRSKPFWKSKAEKAQQQQRTGTAKEELQLRC